MTVVGASLDHGAVANAGSKGLEFLFRFRVSFNDFLPYYQGEATMVEVKDVNGKILWINGRHFRPFVTRDGIKGLFKMTLDSDGKLVSLVKLE